MSLQERKPGGETMIDLLRTILYLPGKKIVLLSCILISNGGSTLRKQVTVMRSGLQVVIGTQKLLPNCERLRSLSREKKGSRMEWLNKSTWKERHRLSSIPLCDNCYQLIPSFLF